MYMSPEQARGEQVDQQSDLFSLGSVLYALCTGSPPYRADSSYGVMRRIIDEVPYSHSRTVNPEHSEHGWLRIVERLMAKEKVRAVSPPPVTFTKLLEACLSHAQQPNLNFVTGYSWPGITRKTKTFLKTRKGILNHD
jgi:eukaryotic-like serine/threonine-protein kinase